MNRSDGFSLVELLVATALTLTAAGAVFTILHPSNPMLTSRGERIDMQQRLRVAADHLFRDLTMAGAGVSAGESVIPLTRMLAPVEPQASGEDGDANRAVRLTYVPAGAAQSSLAAAMAGNSPTAVLEAGSGCSTGVVPCGFSTNTHALVFDEAGFADVFRVTGVNGGFLSLAATNGSGHVYPAGSTIVEVIRRTYFLRTDPSTGISQLARHDGGSAVPVVDHVVDLAFDYFGDPAPPRVVSEPPDSMALTTYGPRPPPASAQVGLHLPGENCVFTFSEGHAPRLTVLAASDGTLAPLTAARLADGPWCPDDLHPSRFDADLLRVRRVSVRVRVQSGIDGLRGPAGSLFRRAGTATQASLLVPDLEATFQLSPENLGVPF